MAGQKEAEATLANANLWEATHHVVENDEVVTVSGGQERVLDWNIDEGVLSPVGFRYTLPRRPIAAV